MAKQKKFVVLKDNENGNVFCCVNAQNIQLDPQTGETIFDIVYTTNDEDLAALVRDDSRKPGWDQEEDERCIERP